MEPKKPETVEERIFAAEMEIKMLLDEFQNFNTSMCADVEEIRQETRENKAMILQTNQVIALMPSQIVKAIQEESRSKRMDAREWMTLAGTVVTIGIAIWAVVK